ncbi:hypothetical protein IAU60_003164 [Kwoniella sp. DSM 27419]
MVNAARLTVPNAMHFARLAGMDDPAIVGQSFIPTPGEPLDPVQLEARWRRWAAYENMRRALDLVYQLDTTLSVMANSPPTIKHLANPYGRVWDDEATFLASSADKWQTAVEACRHRVPPITTLSTGELYRCFLASDPVDHAELALLPVMTRMTLLSGFMATILEHKHEPVPAGFGIPLSAIDHALTRFHRVFLDHTTDPRTQSALVIQFHEQALVYGNVIAIHRKLNEQTLWHSPLGRHMLLHANAIRHLIEEIKVARARVPHMTHTEGPYLAAVVFHRYIQATKGDTTRTQQYYSLNAEVDWGTINDRYGLCCGNMDSPAIQEIDFITGQAVPLINGLRLTKYDIEPFITLLLAIGRTFSRGEELAQRLAALI